MPPIASPRQLAFRRTTEAHYGLVVANESLTVLTYNVYNHHAGETAFSNRMRAIIAVVTSAKPDVVCIQEAPSTGFLRMLGAHLSREQRRYMRVACTEMRRPDGWVEHLGVIHPGTTRTATVHAAPSGENIGIAVHVVGTNLTVVSTHLNPHHADTRHAQAARLCDELPPHGPVLLCGDLNAVPGGGTLATLVTQLRPLAPDASLRSTFPTPLRADLGGNPGAVLDHILGRDVEVEEWGLAGDEPIGGTWPSDHLAIWARVRPMT